MAERVGEIVMACCSGGTLAAGGCNGLENVPATAKQDLDDRSTATSDRNSDDADGLLTSEEIPAGDGGHHDLTRPTKRVAASLDRSHVWSGGGNGVTGSLERTRG